MKIGKQDNETPEQRDARLLVRRSTGAVTGGERWLTPDDISRRRIDHAAELAERDARWARENPLSAASDRLDALWRALRPW